MKTFYFNNIVYYIAGSASVVFAISYFQPALFRIAGLILLLLALAVVTDALLIFAKKNGMSAKRITTDRFSIGDPNKVVLHLKNKHDFPVRVSVIDELPVQFQERNLQVLENAQSGILDVQAGMLDDNPAIANVRARLAIEISKALGVGTHGANAGGMFQLRVQDLQRALGQSPDAAEKSPLQIAREHRDAIKASKS